MLIFGGIKYSTGCHAMNDFDCGYNYQKCNVTSYNISEVDIKGYQSYDLYTQCTNDDNVCTGIYNNYPLYNNAYDEYLMLMNETTRIYSKSNICVFTITELRDEILSNIAGMVFACVYFVVSDMLKRRSERKYFHRMSEYSPLII